MTELLELAPDAGPENALIREGGNEVANPKVGHPGVLDEIGVAGTVIKASAEAVSGGDPTASRIIPGTRIVETNSAKVRDVLLACGFTRGANPLMPALWVADATQAVRASAEEIAAHHYAAKFANQCEYGNNAHTGNFFGYAGVGWAGTKRGFAVELTFKEATVPIYIVPPSTPRVKIWLIKEEGAEETLDEGAEKAALREGYSSVPLPNPEQVLHGSLPSTGTDALTAIWCPATDEYWEIRRLSKFAAGAHKGEWKAGIGGYINGASKHNGVYATGAGKFMGNSASGLVRGPGVITIADLIRVLRGGKIGHMLGVTAAVTAGFLAPATRNDSRENTTAENEAKTEANPAKGLVDAVPEGLRLAWPAGQTAASVGITNPIAAAIYEAGREHGYIVRDSAPNVSFNLADMRAITIGYPPINPAAGATSVSNTAAQLREYVTEPLEALLGTGWSDSSLPRIKEDFHNENPGYLFKNFPWPTIEQLAPVAA